MELVRIPISELEKVWPIVDKDIKNALAYSSQLTDSSFVYETAKQGKFQVWVLWDKDKEQTNEKYFGVVVTELIKRKLGKVCHIYIMTVGNVINGSILLKILKTLLNRGLHNDGIDCKTGWQRVLNNFGYDRTHVVLEKNRTRGEKNEFWRRKFRRKHNKHSVQPYASTRTGVTTNYK